MDTTLASLITELTQQPAFILGEDRLPELEVIDKIKKLGDPDAISVLKLSLAQAKRIAELGKMEMVSASGVDATQLFFIASLAQATVMSLEEAIDACERGR